MHMIVHVLQIMLIYFLHTVHAGHRVYNSDGILRLLSDLEFIMWYFKY